MTSLYWHVFIKSPMFMYDEAFMMFDFTWLLVYSTEMPSVHAEPTWDRADLLPRQQLSMDTYSEHPRPVLSQGCQRLHVMPTSTVFRRRKGRKVVKKGNWFWSWPCCTDLWQDSTQGGLLFSRLRTTAYHVRRPGRLSHFHNGSESDWEI